MTKAITIAGKPLSRFYKLPFEKGSRILKQNVLEMHTAFRVAKNPNLLARKMLWFRQGLLCIEMKLQKEEAVKVYLFVTYDYLLVSCSIDTDETYLSRYAYRMLRAMMWKGSHDFNEYYWPECFDAATGRSKYIEIVKSDIGLKISLKKNFTGLFRPDDYFPDLSQRVALPRSPLKHQNAINDVSMPRIGYCFANTNQVDYRTNHYPFLIPFLFSASVDGKTLKLYEGFVFNEEDVEHLNLSPAQMELNRICFAMKRIATVCHCEDGGSAETIAEINRINQLEILRLWNRALPLLVHQSFKHYLHNYSMKNIAGKPMKKDMELAVFSMEVPVLSFLLRDKGHYYELVLRLKVKGKVLHLSKERMALFLVCAQSKLNLWYLLEAELDYMLLLFFSKVNYKVQVPKGYYKGVFERYVEGIRKWYEVE